MYARVVWSNELRNGKSLLREIRNPTQAREESAASPKKRSILVASIVDIEEVATVVIARVANVLRVLRVTNTCPEERSVVKNFVWP